MSVGKSKGRTLGKHDLLDKIVGKLTGVMTKVNFINYPFIYIDLCAGDGIDTIESGKCSPEILSRHANWLRCKTDNIDAALVILIEKDKATFEQLSNSIYAQQPNTLLINGDARDPIVIEKISDFLKSKNVVESCGAFVSNDPNKFTDWCLTEQVLDIMPNYTCTYNTMGCNVTGLKRLGLKEHRSSWFKIPEPILKRIKEKTTFHDAMLLSLVKDGEQWAYLVTVPKKWKTAITIEATRAFKCWEKGLEFAWLSENQKRINEMLKKLFLTRKEQEDEGNAA